METPQEDTGSHRSRNDLALRSAVSDPVTESRSDRLNVQGPKPSHAKKHELKDAEPQPMSNIQSLQFRSPKNIFRSGLSAEQSQSKDTPSSHLLQTNAPPSKGAAYKSMATTSLPAFILRRNELFEKLKRQAHAEILEKEKPEINIVLDIGRDEQGKPRPTIPVAAKAWESTPGSFLKHVSKDIISDVVIAKVNGKELWDLDRPLEYECQVSYVPFSSAEGRNVFWHSSAHVLGEACECQFNCLLSHGPPVEQGFFYDMSIADGLVSHLKML